MAEASDANPIPVEYVSFGSMQSNNIVKYNFNCSTKVDASSDSTSTYIDSASADLRNSETLHSLFCYFD